MPADEQYFPARLSFPHSRFNSLEPAGHVKLRCNQETSNLSGAVDVLLTIQF